MIEDIIRFSNSSSNLESYEEYWKKADYSDVVNDITENIINTTGFPPSKNMQPIREGVIKITPETNMEQLQGLAEVINKRYHIDCFQIGIDRKNNQAHMLFDFNSRDEAKSVVINRSENIMLNVMIIRFLNLPRPDDADKSLGYFLKDLFNENPAVFDDWLNSLKKKNLSRFDFELAKDLTSFLKQVCRGMAMFGRRKKRTKEESF